MDSNVTVRELAIRLRVTMTYAYNLVRAERLPGAFKADGEWRVPAAALEAYLERRNRRARTVQDASGHSKQVEAVV